MAIRECLIKVLIANTVEIYKGKYWWMDERKKEPVDIKRTKMSK